ncbi:hypothetical protein BT93_J1289 [Corymbia citriodora subsp. variegata]|nr:hypothetical protein BT93_J1289 [Corymbia citriodora subsp. variegata]
MAVVKDMSKVVPLEDPAGGESRLEARIGDRSVSRARGAVAKVRAEVDKLSEKVVSLETNLRGGSWVDGKEFVVLTELLMVKLLELDSIEADGEARVERRIEVCRVQSIVETLDSLKARNSDPLSRSRNATPADSKSEQIESRNGVGIVETLDSLKARNSDPLSGSRNATAADSKSEQIESRNGVVNAQGSLQSSTRITLDWELFD